MFFLLLKVDSPFYAVYLRGQSQEKMSAVTHLRSGDLQGDLKHAVASEIMFWYCYRSKAASQNMWELQEKKSCLQQGLALLGILCLSLVQVQRLG